MTYRGHIENGSVVLDEAVALPEGTAVEVRVSQPSEAPAPDAQRTTLAQRFTDVIGTCAQLPPDMARNHDHYLHGQPRK